MKKIIHKFKTLLYSYQNSLLKYPIKTIFYSVSIFLVLFLLILVFLTRGEVLYSICSSIPEDTFRDYYESLLQALNQPFQNGGIYPPMCYIIYLLMGHLIPSYVLPDLSFNVIREFQGSLMGFTIYFVITFLIFIFLCKKLKKGNKFEKILFTILILISVPFLYQFERSNIIFIALLALMLFLLFKDSKNKILKELSIVFLALSISIKIYPAIFGLLFIKNKKYKELLRLIIYTLILYLIPFLLLGGFDIIATFIHNLTNTTSDFYHNLIRDKVSFITVLDYIFNTFHIKFISKIVYYVLLIVSIFSIFICKSKWKTILLLTCLMIGVPYISFCYTLIFLVIPLIYFLDTKEKRSKIDYVYLALFILALYPLPTTLFSHYKDMLYYMNHWSISAKIMSTSVLLMTILINIETIISFIKKKKVTHK